MLVLTSFLEWKFEIKGSVLGLEGMKDTVQLFFPTDRVLQLIRSFNCPLWKSQDLYMKLQVGDSKLLIDQLEASNRANK